MVSSNDPSSLDTVKISKSFHRPYDVFISYRRETGAELAQLVYHDLTDRGFRVFVDVREMGAGRFDDRLFRVIEQTTDVVLLLTKDCLSRCNSSEDWLRKELAHTIAMKKNIVPLCTDSFEFPAAESLPLELRPLLLCNSVRYIHDHADASLDKLCEHLASKPRNIRLSRVTGMAIAIALLLFILTAVIWSSTRDPDQAAQGKGEAEHSAEHTSAGKDGEKSSDEQGSDSGISVADESGKSDFARFLQLTTAALPAKELPTTTKVASKEAEHFLRRAAEEEWGPAQVQLALELLPVERFPGKRLHLKGDPSQALKWIEKAEKSITEESDKSVRGYKHLILFYIHREGLGTGIDETLAKTNLDKAVELNNAHAIWTKSVEVYKGTLGYTTTDKEQCGGLMARAARLDPHYALRRARNASINFNAGLIAYREAVKWHTEPWVRDEFLFFLSDCIRADYLKWAQSRNHRLSEDTRFTDQLRHALGLGPKANGDYNQHVLQDIELTRSLRDDPEGWFERAQRVRLAPIFGGYGVTQVTYYRFSRLGPGAFARFCLEQAASQEHPEAQMLVKTKTKTDLDEHITMRMKDSSPSPEKASYYLARGIDYEEMNALPEAAWAFARSGFEGNDDALEKLSKTLESIGQLDAQQVAIIAQCPWYGNPKDLKTLQQELSLTNRKTRQPLSYRLNITRAQAVQAIVLSHYELADTRIKKLKETILAELTDATDQVEKEADQ